MMDSSFFLLLLAGALTSLIPATLARDFYVGDSSGWTETPSKSYTKWAEDKRFQVNDTLVFKYKKTEDSVLVVSKSDFHACNINAPLQMLQGDNKDASSSSFKFDRSGPFYFISGAAGHCEKGQKMKVVVIAIRHGGTTTNPTPASPAPTVSSPSPSPKSILSPSPSPSPKPLLISSPSPTPSSVSSAPPSPVPMTPSSPSPTPSSVSSPSPSPVPLNPSSPSPTPSSVSSPSPSPVPMTLSPPSPTPSSVSSPSQSPAASGVSPMSQPPKPVPSVSSSSPTSAPTPQPMSSSSVLSVSAASFGLAALFLSTALF